MNDEFSLEDLVSISGLSLRTVRYYIQEGLLPGPDSRGKNARYTEEHLKRLEWIQRLKEHHRPLGEIRILLNNMTPKEIKALLEGQDMMQDFLSNFKENGESASSSSPVGLTALEYIRGIEGKLPNIQESTDKKKRSPVANETTTVLISTGNQENRESVSPIHFRESWQRIIIRDGIELNLRIPISSKDEARINELIALSRQLFKNT